MKNSIVCLATAALTLVACNKNVPSDTQPAAANDGFCNLTVNLDVPATKSIGIVGDATDECKINNVNVFVFYADGLLADQLETSQTAPSASAVNIRCTTGKKKIVVLTNYQADELPLTYSEMMQTVYIQVEDQSRNSMTMLGEADVDLKANQTVDIQVKRYVARVKLGKISRNFTNPALADLDFTVRRVYMSNVVHFISLDRANADGWLNLGNELECTEDILHNGFTRSMPNSTDFMANLSFYPFPNEDSTYHTRLVIEAELGSSTCYYTINLPAVIESNKSYNFSSINLTRAGGVTPDDAASSYSLTFNLIVEGWGEGANITEPVNY